MTAGNTSSQQIGIIGGEFADNRRGDLPNVFWMERYGTGEPLKTQEKRVLWPGLKLAAVGWIVPVLICGLGGSSVFGMVVVALVSSFVALVVGIGIATKKICADNGYVFPLASDAWYAVPVRVWRQGGGFISDVGGRLWFCTASGGRHDKDLQFGKAVPWESLAAFEIASHSRYFRTQFGWPKLRDWLVIVAHVDDGTVLPVVNCADRTQAEMAQLHAVLTREFIGRRGPILQHEEALRLGVLSAVRQATWPNGM